ncbi:G2 M phase-specific E3 ubiquitin- ligase-like protein [Labeo rohita]|uniref:G2 M phase-specific E3 ubiquitin-ligase-like protein n=1 Tax=Labeo rohita TaxID=84645 RepID=A0A498P166_LABRO|nr:G2 M phase-specific E3 ubiquitin- ligase-like protein [Labeo rohita]
MADAKEEDDLRNMALNLVARLRATLNNPTPKRGSGQRKLNLLTPEEEGYTGASLVKSWGGKGWLYIMPIQNTLDISPLPFTALEFQAMPKARNTNEGDADISEDTDEHFGRVSFIGENGIDQGALCKEFLTEMVCGIEARFFEGDGERGKNPKYSICDYQDNSFKTCGEIFATSLVQGGPAPNFLTRWCYHFLCHGEMDKDVGVLEVTDQDIKNLMTEVENAEGGERLIDLSDAIVACGYTGPINVDQKKAITDAIALHALVRLIPILNQLRE